jgi:hypothetical protein
MSGGPAKSILGVAAWLSVAFGVGYLIDCRFSGDKNVQECWFTAAGYLGIGGTSRAAYSAGFWTPNPGIRQGERDRVARTDTPIP